MDVHIEPVASPLARILLPSYLSPDFDNHETLRRLTAGVQARETRSNARPPHTCVETPPSFRPVQDSEAALCALMAHAYASVPTGTLVKVILLLKARRV
jgi:hypothetical protein